jgi:protease-4
MDKVKEVADGRIFTGRQALKAGLIDEIGYEPSALNYLRTKKGIDTTRLEIKNYDISEPIGNFSFKRFFGLIGGFGKGLSPNNESGVMAVYQGE